MLFYSGNKVHKHALSAEDPANSNVSVKSIEWDPLSTDYLLVATAQSTIMLVDSNTASVVMCFELPSAAAETHTLAWLSCAPGMFITGG
jgi:WD repeat-containing protein 17